MFSKILLRRERVLTKGIPKKSREARLSIVSAPEIGESVGKKKMSGNCPKKVCATHLCVSKKGGGKNPPERVLSFVRSIREPRLTGEGPGKGSVSLGEALALRQQTREKR